MTVNIMAKGFELVQGVHDGVHNELSELNKIIDEDASYRVTLKKREYHEIECIIHTVIDSRTYNVRATRSTVKYAVGAATKALKEMVLESRAKVISKKLAEKGRVNKEENIQDDIVTKHKDVHLTPVSDAEAIEELNNSDFDMYMYLDEKTLEVKGVYHRAKGYGVITFKTE